VSRTGDPGARGATRRDSRARQERACSFARALRPVTCSVHASGTRRREPARADCGSQAPGAATHRGGQRNRRPLAPAGSGAKASLAREDRRLVGCVRASNSVAEVGERRRGSEKRDFPWQGGAWTGTQAPRFSQELRGAAKASTSGTVVAKPRRRGRPEPDVRKGIAGRRSSRDGRHPGSSLESSVHAGGLKAALAALTSLVHARASRARGRGDRGVRGKACTHRDGKKTPAAVR